MNDKKNGKLTFLQGFLYFVMTAELFVIADAVTAECSHPMPIILGIGAEAVVFVLLCLLRPLREKQVLLVDIILPVMCLALLAGALGIWRYSAVKGGYTQIDNGKAELFADKKVMVFAPHEDDDICLIGGTAEEFKRYGSEVKIVFVTNGDNSGIQATEVRCNEALAGAAKYGVGEDDVIFLGYGDGWADKHILWGDEGEVLISAAGKMETYGAERKPVYKKDVPYIRENLIAAVEELIRDYSPDILIACDNDHHYDHVCTSMAVEDALGRILRDGNGYSPVFLKGFSYYTAYFANEDFYDNINLSSTLEFNIEDVRPEYRWEDRVRFPVSAGSISRVLNLSGIYQQLKCHRSQLAAHQAQRIINGDKVFWQRRTDSLCNSAIIETSSGNGEYLKDIMIGYPRFGTLGEMSENVWTPTDDEKTFTVYFGKKTDVDHVVLYDAKDKAANILNAEISFDDGSVFITGALNADGAGDKIKTNVKNVSSMTVRLLDTEGEDAGLAEIEAFAAEKQNLPHFIKVTDLAGNFVYDYYIDESGYEEFMLWGADTVDSEDYQLEFTTKGNASAEIKDGKICVSCPENGSECVAVVSSADGRYSDTVRFVNADSAMRIGFALENIAVNKWMLLKDSVTYKIIVAAYHLLGGQNIVL